MEKIFHSINGAWAGFERTNRRGGVPRRRVERELVKDNQGGPDMGAVEGPRSADNAPAANPAHRDSCNFQTKTFSMDLIYKI